MSKDKVEAEIQYVQLEEKALYYSETVSRLEPSYAYAEGVRRTFMARFPAFKVPEDKRLVGKVRVLVELRGTVNRHKGLALILRKFGVPTKLFQRLGVGKFPVSATKKVEVPVYLDFVGFPAMLLPRADPIIPILVCDAKVDNGE